MARPLSPLLVRIELQCYTHRDFHRYLGPCARGLLDIEAVDIRYQDIEELRDG